jgi:hypothetical protein
LSTADDWIRSNYYVSDIPANGKRTQQETLGAPYSFLGNLLLSKIPINELYCWRFSETCKPLNRGTVTCLQIGTPQIFINLLVAAVIGVFNAVTADGSNIKLGVCSIHTTAYEELFKAREFQLEEITRVLDNNLGLSDYYLMGDMNLHVKGEDDQIERLGLIDLWHETHKFDHHIVENSFTFDAKRNTLVQMTYLNLERRQMRLDRVFWKSKNRTESRKRFHPASDLKVWADQPVAENDYLFISDHFGLFLDITTDPDQAFDIETENQAEVAWPQNSFVSLTKRGRIDAGLGMLSAIWNVAKTRVVKLRK